MLDAMSFPARAGSARAGLRLRLRIRRVRGCGLGPGCPSVGGYPYIPPQSREVPVLSSIYGASYLWERPVFSFYGCLLLWFVNVPCCSSCVAEVRAIQLVSRPRPRHL